MIYLDEISGDGEIYSFGRVRCRTAQMLIEVGYRGCKRRIRTTSGYAPGEWVKFCGRLRDNVIEPTFIVRIAGCDVKILERGIEYVRRNNI